MKVAAAYIRVSTDEQVEYSPDSQLKELKDYAARHDMIIDPNHIYIDAGISGRKASKRPQFQSMIAAAKNKPRPFEYILVWKFSRFARNQEESILYKSLLRKECQVEVCSVTEETGDSMFGSLIERIIEWMDEFYSIRLGEEVRAKMALIAGKGLVQTVAPFGYKNGPDKTLVINDEEAKWVRHMAEQVLAGKSYLSIARELNAAGVRTHRGSKLENRTVEYILRNVTNKGALHWTPNQKDHTDGGRNPYSDTTIIIEDACPAIFTKEYFDEIIAEMDKRKRLRKKYDKPDETKKHWLSGFLKCSNCGSTLVYQNKHGGFQCHKYSRSVCEVSHYISAKKVEEAVIKALAEVTITDTFVESITKPAVAINDYSKDIEKLEAMLERAKEAYVRGIDNIQEYAQNKEHITKELDALKELSKCQISEELPKTEVVARKFNSVMDLLQSDIDNDVKRNALAEIVEKITFVKAENTIEIYYKLG